MLRAIGILKKDAETAQKLLHLDRVPIIQEELWTQHFRSTDCSLSYLCVFIYLFIFLFNAQNKTKQNQTDLGISLRTFISFC